MVQSSSVTNIFFKSNKKGRTRIYREVGTSEKHYVVFTSPFLGPLENHTSLETANISDFNVQYSIVVCKYVGILIRLSDRPSPEYAMHIMHGWIIFHLFLQTVYTMLCNPLNQMDHEIGRKAAPRFSFIMTRHNNLQGISKLTHLGYIKICPVMSQVVSDTF